MQVGNYDKVNDKVMMRIHPVHLMNLEQCRAADNPHTKSIY